MPLSQIKGVELPYQWFIAAKCETDFKINTIKSFNNIISFIITNPCVILVIYLGLRKITPAYFELSLLLLFGYRLKPSERLRKWNLGKWTDTDDQRRCLFLNYLKREFTIKRRAKPNQCSFNALAFHCYAVIKHNISPKKQLISNSTKSNRENLSSEHSSQSATQIYTLVRTY